MITTFSPLPSLQPWDTFEGPPPEEPIRACFRGRVFYFHDSRQAWNYTTSRKFPSNNAIHPTLLLAKTAVETRRVQGSQWEIKELPALVLEGDTQILVVTEINTQTPFSDLSALIPTRWTLKAAGEILTTPKKNRIFRFRASKGTFSPTEGPSQRFASRSVGAKERCWLSWVSSPLDLDERNLHLILTRWDRVIKAGGEGAPIE